jgi:recombinational DNA repair ATPase RecF
MRYRTFDIQNYKSFVASGTLTFSPGLNVVIGQNDVGKSTLLEALALNFPDIPHRSAGTIPFPGALPLNQTSKAVFSFSVQLEEVHQVVRATVGNDVFYMKGISGRPSDDLKPLQDLLKSGLTVGAYFQGGGLAGG